MPRKPDTEIRQQAIDAADTRATPRKPLTWGQALAEAPWPKTPTTHPAAWEIDFRRIYAAQLVKRGAAVKAERTGKSSGPSGKTDLQRKTVYLTRDERRAQEIKAAEAGLSWSMWARRRLSQ